MPTSGGVLARQANKALGMAVVVLLLGNVVALSAHEGHSEETVGPTPSQAGDASGSAHTTVGQPSGSGAVSARPEPTNEAKRDQQSATRVTTTTPTYTPPTPSMYPDGYEFEMTVSPSCVVPGQELAATVHLKKMGGVSMTATYADGETHGTQYSGISFDGGPVTYKWKAPTVPGEAKMTAQAHDPDNKRNGWKTIVFRVVKAGELC